MTNSTTTIHAVVVRNIGISLATIARWISLVEDTRFLFARDVKIVHSLTFLCYYYLSIWDCICQVLGG